MAKITPKPPVVYTNAGSTSALLTSKPLADWNQYTDPLALLISSLISVSSRAYFHRCSYKHRHCVISKRVQPPRCVFSIMARPSSLRVL